MRPTRKCSVCGTGLNRGEGRWVCDECGISIAIHKRADRAHSLPGVGTIIVHVHQFGDSATTFGFDVDSAAADVSQLRTLSAGVMPTIEAAMAASDAAVHQGAACWESCGPWELVCECGTTLTPPFVSGGAATSPAGSASMGKVPADYVCPDCGTRYEYRGGELQVNGPGPQAA